MGLVNQLGEFSSEISRNIGPLRSLLSKKNVFVWMKEHQESFDKIKMCLSSPPILCQFDPKKETVLQTDASKLNGLGYALLQRYENQWRVVQCGSRFLSDTESRYAIIELELLAAVWAMKKCQTYLLGLNNFSLAVDHRPLVPILDNQKLNELENPRLQRLKEKTARFNFTTRWVKGKDHQIPDALSRAPTNNPQSTDEEAERELEHYVRQVNIKFDQENIESRIDDPNIEKLRTIAKDDIQYQEIVNAVNKGLFVKSDKFTAILPYWNIKNELSTDDGLVLYGRRIVVPLDSRS